MRTTIDVADMLWTKAKKHAASAGCSVTRVVEDALRQYFSQIEDKPKKYSFKVRIPRSAGRPWMDPSDREAFLKAMDEEP
jgi:hypothetical protein